MGAEYDGAIAARRFMFEALTEMDKRSAIGMVLDAESDVCLGEFDFSTNGYAVWVHAYNLASKPISRDTVKRLASQLSLAFGRDIHLNVYCGPPVCFPQEEIE